MNRFIKGDKIEVISSTHSGLMPQDIGEVQNNIGCGYAVYFEKTRFIKGSGGGDGSRPAIVYLQDSEIKPATPANDNQTETKNS